MVNFLSMLLCDRDQFVVAGRLNDDAAVALDKFVHIDSSYGYHSGRLLG